jgi:hypothetical protein
VHALDAAGRCAGAIAIGPVRIGFRLNLIANGRILSHRCVANMHRASLWFHGSLLLILAASASSAHGEQAAKSRIGLWDEERHVAVASVRTSHD